MSKTKRDTSNRAAGELNGPAPQDARISAVGDQLRASFGALLRSIPGGPLRAQELARYLSVNKDLSNRLVNAVKKQDPLAVMHVIPGPDPLRRFLQAATKKGLDAKEIKKAYAAVEQFEVLIREEAGDRAYLEAIISAWLPEARQRSDLINKQAVFKSMSQIKGASAEVRFVTAILFPAKPKGEYDVSVALVSGQVGLRRVRPDAIVSVSTLRTKIPQHVRPRTLDGEPVSDFTRVRLDEFCSSNPAEALEVHEAGDSVHYVLPQGEAGRGAVVDLITAELNPNCLCSKWREADPNDSISAVVSLPYRSLVLDVLIHPDLTTFGEPTLQVHDTAPRGLVEIGDESRTVDRLDIVEPVTRLKGGVQRYRSSVVPNYVELMQHVSGRIGLDADTLEGFRCRSQYPLYGCQISMVFEKDAR
jgi:hypothetical protein